MSPPSPDKKIGSYKQMYCRNVDIICMKHTKLQCPLFILVTGLKLKVVNYQSCYNSSLRWAWISVPNIKEIHRIVVVTFSSKPQIWTWWLPELLRFILWRPGPKFRAIHPIVWDIGVWTDNTAISTTTSPAWLKSINWDKVTSTTINKI